MLIFAFISNNFFCCCSSHWILFRRISNLYYSQIQNVKFVIEVFAPINSCTSVFKSLYLKHIPVIQYPCYLIAPFLFCSLIIARILRNAKGSRDTFTEVFNTPSRLCFLTWGGSIDDQTPNVFCFAVRIRYLMKDYITLIPSFSCRALEFCSYKPLLLSIQTPLPLFNSSLLTLSSCEEVCVYSYTWIIYFMSFTIIYVHIISP